jgi:lipoprotein-anchoring transpeptidase ErfK/SrfK
VAPAPTSGGTRGFLSSLGTSGLGIVVGASLAFGGLAVAGIATAHPRGGSARPAAALSGAGGPAATSPVATAPAAAAAPVAAVPVSRSELSRLPQATTYGTTEAAPVDLTGRSDGTVVTVDETVAAFARPGGPAVARIPKTQLGLETWLPVLERAPGWSRVRLPSRPNGATAWVPDGRLRAAHTTWAVRVDLGSERLTVTHDGAAVGSWAIGHGMLDTPTPVGETFLLASFTDRNQSYSPVIFATGSHSDTLDGYGGGPGTVAVHGWPTRSGRLGAVSHGCVRVPAAALEQFRKLPLGTPISITS